MKLVIVESPAKCAKIQGYLGDGYTVKATMGHIRSLEENLDSIGIERGWEPTYKEIATKKDAIAKLRAATKGCEVILAADDDREGEAIAWHTCFILKLNPATTERIVFHEITKPAILAAVANPRRLDLNKVNAQQARSMLDLLVGFTISRVLWNQVAPKLSAGRCQTPALRLVLERDQEVENHKATAFWRLSGQWNTKTPNTIPLHAVAQKDLATKAESQRFLQSVVSATDSTVLTVNETVSVSQPPKPLITSTLQQEASNRGISPKVAMNAAQKLYEAGHITYMRTDNATLSEDAVTAIRKYVEETHGPLYLAKEADEKPEIPKIKKAVKKTGKKEEVAPQAAHEAIRPTKADLTDAPVDDATQRTVYRLIWLRATQSQMAPAETDVRKTTLHIDASKEIVWSIEQHKLRFAGWKVLEPQNAETATAELAAWKAWKTLKAGAKLHWSALQADEQFTKPKGRFTEASLISDLERRGIGRPSTFATLISTILERDYVEKTNTEGTVQDSQHLSLKPKTWPPVETVEKHKVGAEKNKLRATPLGKSVAEFLFKEYSDLFNYEFTAGMERSLDEIAQGTKEWKSLLQTTWDTYKERYSEHSKPGTGKANKERVLAPNIKVIQSRKGPLFVKEASVPVQVPEKAVKGKKAVKEKATFAPLPPTKTFETVTAEDAEVAFRVAAEVAAGELVGALTTGEEIRKKKGPYGSYAQCKGFNIPWKDGDSLDQIKDKLVAKITFATGEATDASGAKIVPFDRKVGDFTIKRGPYGLYFFKHTLKRVTFLKCTAPDPATVTVTELNDLYSKGLAQKRKFPGKKAKDTA